MMPPEPGQCQGFIDKCCL